MKKRSIIHSSIEFGTFHARENILSFTLKCMFYIIPAVILGNHTDITIKNIKRDKTFGDYTLYYIVLQTLIIISSLYLILFFVSKYSSEFQVTIAGAFFIVLYFGVQTNYIDMIKEYTSY